MIDCRLTNYFQRYRNITCILHLEIHDIVYRRFCLEFYFVTLTQFLWNKVNYFLHITVLSRLCPFCLINHRFPDFIFLQHNFGRESRLNPKQGTRQQAADNRTRSLHESMAELRCDGMLYRPSQSAGTRGTSSISITRTHVSSVK